jgi:hypothetical protein
MELVIDYEFLKGLNDEVVKRKWVWWPIMSYRHFILRVRT